MTSRELYSLYRQVADLRDILEKELKESWKFEDAVKKAGSLAEELFDVVGKLAAYEIDNEYWDKKNNNTD